MGAVRALTVSAVRRRRLQGAIIGFVLLLATLASTVALDILVGSRAPFDTAFDAANGAHLVMSFDLGPATEARLAATATVDGVEAAAGPWRVGQAGFLVNADDVAKGMAAGYIPGTVSARPTPDGTVDRITLLEGRWWQGPGEIVLSRAQAAIAAAGGVRIGGTVRLADLGGLAAPGVAVHGPADPVSLRVVGVAASISTPETRAWLSPADLASLQSDSAAPTLQMLYRVADPTSQAVLAAVRDRIAARVPADAVTGTTTWLGLRMGADLTATLMVPILLAFAGFAFLAAAFVIVNVVSGVVVGSLRQIGLLKAVGATPRQVTTILVGEVLAPAAVGAIVGTAVGSLASGPILGESAAALGVPQLAGVSPAVLAGVPTVALLVTLAAAVGPAVRGGRLATTDAMARGSTPAGARSRTGRPRPLPPWLPDSVRLGLRRLRARPLRTAMTLGALVVGVAALSFTLGMESSLRHVGIALFRDHASPVRVDVPVGLGATFVMPGRTAGPAPLTPAAVEAAIAREPATDRYVAIGEADAAIAGYPNPVPFFAYRGDTSWLGYVLIEGRWFTAPGEIVVPDNFLRQTGHRVGDSLTGTVGTSSLHLTIVGSILDNARCRCDGPRNVVMRGDWSTLAAAVPDLAPSSWEVVPNGLMTAAALAQEIRQRTSGFADAYPADSSDTDEGFLFFEGVIASLGAILVAVSLGGVANTVLLESRERLRETAILRAVGMTPRQIIAMVAASVMPLGAIAAVAGLPIGQALQRAVIVNMGEVAISSAVPESLTNVLAATDMVAVLAGGLAIALVGAWLPARRTARVAIAPILAAE